ncbi:cation transporter [Sphingobium subterraneum]|jgi:Co/Zn/Cd efflux system component|uniref:Co/Zn/Cd efflux system component n=1 Tax=Sphingobium subterraneum TaxID=627688 RepID=A0A841J551_9SPHN|nr:cation transporter [Sphingobium subterraneum]MBB6125472.1 Co/Zn/Cd efflux system component [Sphingobium subterraneum]
MADQCCASACGAKDTLNDPRWRKVLWIALGLNATMFAVEIIASIVTGSRSLQADALDFLGDSANYAISLGVVGMALAWRARAALVKGLTILLFGLAVLASAVWGLIEGVTPDPLAMGVVGFMALVVNVSVALMLYRYRTGDSNMRSVWICSRNDAINNLLVIGAGLAVMWSSSGIPDQLVAFVMALLGISGGWQIVRQATIELNELRAEGAL